MGRAGPMGQLIMDFTVSAERRGSVTPPAVGKLGSIMSCWPTSGDRARGANDVGIDDENDAHSLLIGVSNGAAPVDAPIL